VIETGGADNTVRFYFLSTGLLFRALTICTFDVLRAPVGAFLICCTLKKNVKQLGKKS